MRNQKYRVSTNLKIKKDREIFATKLGRELYVLLKNMDFQNSKEVKKYVNEKVK